MKLVVHYLKHVYDDPKDPAVLTVTYTDVVNVEYKPGANDAYITTKYNLAAALPTNWIRMELFP